MYTKEDYISAVNAFNDLKSFNIILPERLLDGGDQDEELYNEFYEKLADQFTDEIMKMKSILEIYEVYRKKGIVKNEISTDICAFVVHVNQVTNNLKSFDDPIVSFCV
jgi:hypothetical protein